MDVKEQLLKSKDYNCKIKILDEKIKKQAIKSFYHYGIAETIESYNKAVETYNQKRKMIINMLINKYLILSIKQMNFGESFLEHIYKKKSLDELCIKENVSLRTLFRKFSKIEQKYKGKTIESIIKEIKGV